MKIIPAIDIINGQCVRLSEGDYSTKKVYFKDPLDAALSFEKAGVKYLHLVDLDGAKAGAVKNWDILERITRSTNLHVDFSGGIKSTEQVERAFNLGAKQVAIGSLSVKDPKIVKEWLKSYGADKIIIGADVKNERIAIHGWQETADLSVFDFMKDYLDAGATTFLCTDVSKDGMLDGPSFDLYQKILNQFNDLELIASGGVTTNKDVVDLEKQGCSAAIIGKAIYEGRIDLKALIKKSHGTN